MPSTTTADVLIVGAGLAGLQAAYSCHQAGLSVLVLEARDRVGGKTWTRPCSRCKGAVDVGAAWINDSNQSEMYALGRKLGLEFVQQITYGDCVVHDLDGQSKKFAYGDVPGHAPSEAQNMVSIRSLLEKLCHTIDLRDPKGPAEWDKMTLEEFIRANGGGETALATARLWTRGMLALEPRDMSALFFLDYVKAGGGLMQTRSDMKHGGQYLRIRQGTQSFSTGLAAFLPSHSLQLNTPVVSISQSSSGVTITSRSGQQFTGRRAILSIPTTLYPSITFSPPLPPAKRQFCESVTMGYLIKTIVCYSSPWWRASGFSGLVQSFEGPVTITRDTSVDVDGQFSLTCFGQGDTGRAWASLPPEERRRQVLEHVVRSFGEENRAKAYAPTEIFEQRWNDEEWSRGGPQPVMGPGIMSGIGKVLRDSVGRVHFVGTETAYEWKGYMEGAVRSGIRGAQEVVQALESEKGDRARL